MKQRMMARPAHPARHASSVAVSRGLRNGLVLVVGAVVVLGALAFSGLFNGGTPASTAPAGTFVAAAPTDGASAAPWETTRPSPRHTSVPVRAPTATPPTEPTSRPTGSPRDP